MELKKVLANIEGLKAKGSLKLEVSSIECDYREVKEGSMFVAIKGYEVDGHTFINKAIEKELKTKEKKSKKKTTKKKTNSKKEK